MTCFVFRITELCNKRCPTCCCGPRPAVTTMAPGELEKLLVQIQDRAVLEDVPPVIMFTGGECFLYRRDDAFGKRSTIVDVVELTQRIIPTAAVILKTSGWCPHPHLDALLAQVMHARYATHLEVRLGFNLFQNGGVDAHARFRHMLELILAFQNTVRVETIYNRENMVQTLAVMEDVLHAMEIPVVGLGTCLTRPDEGCRAMVPLDAEGRRMMLLTAMPAHPGSSGCDSGRFDEAAAVPCPAIEGEALTIMYEPSLAFRPCDDAFADFSAPAFPGNAWPTVEEQLAFLRKSFAALRCQLHEESIRFSTRRERCMFCACFLQRQAGARLREHALAEASRAV